MPDSDNHKQAETPHKDGWLIAAIVVVTLVLVAVLAYAILSTAGLLPSPELTQPTTFITITQPTQGDSLDLTWVVTVKGQAGGLFEGHLLVQALSASGEVLAQQPTIIDAPEAGTGGSGSFSVDLNIRAEPGSQGQIVAFSTSAKDGSIVAIDSVDVGYGESPTRDELVIPEDHFWKLVALNGQPLIENTLITLQFENFQASGSGACNRYNTSYERSATSLNFGLVTSTAIECELPEGVLAQESAYFSALEQVAAYRIENQGLNLFDNSGNQLLTYAAVVMGNILDSDETQLPEDALVYVRLDDVSLADAEAKPIAEQVISGISQFPIPYSVAYNPKEIIENHTYAIVVRIEDSSGNLLLINPTIYPVITAGNPSQLDIVVEAIQ
jgi:putative lipoprotein